MEGYGVDKSESKPHKIISLGLTYNDLLQSEKKL